MAQCIGFHAFPRHRITQFVFLFSMLQSRILTLSTVYCTSLLATLNSRDFVAKQGDHSTSPEEHRSGLTWRVAEATERGSLGFTVPGVPNSSRLEDA